MKNYLLCIFTFLIPAAIFAQPMPNEVPGSYNCNFGYYYETGVVQYAVLNDKLIFTSDSSLWVTDGSAQGTQLLRTFKPQTGQPRGFAEMNGKMYFVATDPQYGRELWETDGTIAGTTIVADINAGPASSIPAPPIQYPYTCLQVLNGKLYFAANDSINGLELWSSDGTAGGTGLFHDICPGSCDGIMSNSDLLSVGNLLYYAGSEPTFYGGVFRTDGSLQGTFQVADSLPFIGNLIPYGNKLVFSGSACGIPDVYITDGTVNGCTKLLGGTENSLDHAELNGKLYFFAKNSSSSYSLFETDGTATGTISVKDSFNIDNGLLMIKVFELSVVNNKLLFSARRSGSNWGHEMYTSDGTSAGTVILKDIRPGNLNSVPMNFCAFNNEIYFQAWDSLRIGLWHTDGTLPGTQFIDMPANSYYPMTLLGSRAVRLRPIVTTGSSIYFVANYDTSLGFRIYKLDVFPVGVGGEQRVSSIDIYPNPADGYLNVDVRDAVRVSIHSITGARVYEASIKAGEVNHRADVSDFAAGTYSITTISKDGRKQYGKFVKQ